MHVQGTQVRHVQALDRQLATSKEAIARTRRDIEKEKARIAALKEETRKQGVTISGYERLISHLQAAAPAPEPAPAPAPPSDVDGMERLREALRRAQADAEAYRNQSMRRQDEIDSLRAQLADLRAQLAAALAAAEQARNSRPDNDAELAAARETIRDLRAQLDALRGQVASLNAQLSVTSPGPAADTSAWQARIAELMAANAELQRQVNALTVQLAEKMAALDLAQQRQDLLLSQRDERLEAAHRASADALDLLRKTVQELNAQLAAARAEIAALKGRWPRDEPGSGAGAILGDELTAPAEVQTDPLPQQDDSRLLALQAQLDELRGLIRAPTPAPAPAPAPAPEPEPEPEPEPAGPGGPFVLTGHWQELPPAHEAYRWAGGWGYVSLQRAAQWVEDADPWAAVAAAAEAAPASSLPPVGTPAGAALDAARKRIISMRELQQTAQQTLRQLRGDVGDAAAEAWGPLLPAETQVEVEGSAVRVRAPAEWTVMVEVALPPGTLLHQHAVFDRLWAAAVPLGGRRGPRSEHASTCLMRTGDGQSRSRRQGAQAPDLLPSAALMVPLRASRSWRVRDLKEAVGACGLLGDVPPALWDMACPGAPASVRQAAGPGLLSAPVPPLLSLEDSGLGGVPVEAAAVPEGQPPAPTPCTSMVSVVGGVRAAAGVWGEAWGMWVPESRRGGNQAGIPDAPHSTSPLGPWMWPRLVEGPDAPPGLDHPGGLASWTMPPDAGVVDPATSLYVNGSATLAQVKAFEWSPVVLLAPALHEGGMAGAARALARAKSQPQESQGRGRGAPSGSGLPQAVLDAMDDIEDDMLDASSLALRNAAGHQAAVLAWCAASGVVPPGWAAPKDVHALLEHGTVQRFARGRGGTSAAAAAAAEMALGVHTPHPPFSTQAPGIAPPLGAAFAHTEEEIQSQLDITTHALLDAVDELAHTASLPFGLPHPTESAPALNGLDPWWRAWAHAKARDVFSGQRDEPDVLSPSDFESMVASLSQAPKPLRLCKYARAGREGERFVSRAALPDAASSQQAKVEAEKLVRARLAAAGLTPSPDAGLLLDARGVDLVVHWWRGVWQDSVWRTALDGGHDPFGIGADTTVDSLGSVPPSVDGSFAGGGTSARSDLDEDSFTHPPIASSAGAAAAASGSVPRTVPEEASQHPVHGDEFSFGDAPAPAPTPPPAQVATPPAWLAVGAPVEAQFHGDPAEYWYAGVVGAVARDTSMPGGWAIDVKYDDGDFDAGLPLECVHPLEGERARLDSPAPAPAHAHAPAPAVPGASQPVSASRVASESSADEYSALRASPRPSTASSKPAEGGSGSPAASSGTSDEDSVQPMGRRAQSRGLHEDGDGSGEEDIVEDVGGEAAAPGPAAESSSGAAQPTRRMRGVAQLSDELSDLEEEELDEDAGQDVEASFATVSTLSAAGEQAGTRPSE